MAEDPTKTDPAPDPAPKPADKGGKKPDDAPPPKKVETTEEEIEARLESARADERKKLEAKAKKDKDDSAADAAKKQGEYEKLYKQEQEKRQALEADVRRRDLSDRVRTYLAENHAAYVAEPKARPEAYVLPLLSDLAADAAPEDVTKAVKTAAEQYVRDNPRAKEDRATGAAPPVPGGSRVSAGRKAAPTNHAPGVAASRF